MSARIFAFPGRAGEPPVDLSQRLEVAQRLYLAVEDAIAGKWSDSNLISRLVGATPAERELILAELEARQARRISAPNPGSTS